MYIRAACTASAKITVTEADDEPRSVPQIDWNVFLLLQDDLPVGYVDVRKGPLGNPIESWTLFMKIPSKDTRYLSPGERSPSEPPAHYTLQYTLLPGTPFKTFAPGTEYVNVDADCSRGPL